MQPLAYSRWHEPWFSIRSPLQRYGLLLSGALLAASPQNDPDREKLMDYTYETWQLV